MRFYCIELTDTPVNNESYLVRIHLDGEDVKQDLYKYAFPSSKATRDAAPYPEMAEAKGETKPTEISTSIIDPSIYTDKTAGAIDWTKVNPNLDASDIQYGTFPPLPGGEDAYDPEVDTFLDMLTRISTAGCCIIVKM